MIRRFIVIFLFVWCVSCFIQSSYAFQENPPYEIVRELQALNSYVMVVKDSLGSLFVVKQKKAISLAAQWALVADALGSHIAASLALPCNEVHLISFREPFPGKKYQDYAATLHSYLSGVAVYKSNNQFRSLRIAQPYKVPKKKRGLRYTTIRHMTKHPDLPALCALDTFLGNTDRCCENVLYDSETNHFYAFDFDESFKIPLCKIACYQLKKMQKKRIVLSVQERKALTIYCDTLKTLIALYPPAQLFGLMEQYAAQAISLYRHGHGTVELQLIAFKRFYREHYKDALLLVQYLQKII